MAKIVITLYLITVTLVMMNLLIAKMGETYNRIAEHSEVEWILERARVLSSIEAEMTPSERESVHGSYWVKDRYGRNCFQVQDYDPSYWSRVEVPPLLRVRGQSRMRYCLGRRAYVDSDMGKACVRGVFPTTSVRCSRFLLRWPVARGRHGARCVGASAAVNP